MTDGAYSLDWFDSWGRAFALVMGSYALTFAIAVNHGGRSVFSSALVAGLGIWLFATHLVGYLLNVIVFGLPERGVAIQWDDYALCMSVASGAIGIVAILASALAFERKPAGGTLPNRVITVLLVTLLIFTLAVSLFLPEIIAVWKGDPDSYYLPPLVRF